MVFCTETVTPGSGDQTIVAPNVDDQQIVGSTQNDLPIVTENNSNAGASDSGDLGIFTPAVPPVTAPIYSGVPDNSFNYQQPTLMSNTEGSVINAPSVQGDTGPGLFIALIPASMFVCFKLRKFNYNGK